MNIPITTYAQAMRIAVKYSMDNVQTAIIRVINSLSSKSGVDTAIARLAFLAEFHGHFPKGAIKRVFVQACSKEYRPSGHELRPLMAYPNLVALMMQYREGIIKPDQAIWNEVVAAPSGGSTAARRSVGTPLPPFGAFSVGAFGQPATTTTGFTALPAPVLTFSPVLAPKDRWLDEQFKSLGFA